MVKSIKTDVYGMVISEKRNSLMHLIFNLVETTIPAEVLAGIMTNFKMADEYLLLRQEISDKEHIMNWCKDINCPDNKKE